MSSPVRGPQADAQRRRDHGEIVGNLLVEHLERRRRRGNEEAAGDPRRSAGKKLRGTEDQDVSR